MILDRLTNAEDKVIAYLNTWDDLERMVALKALRVSFYPRQSMEPTALEREIKRLAK